MATTYDMLRDDPEIDESEIDFSDLQAQYEVRLEEGLDTFVVIDGLPVVHDEEKMKKLRAVLVRKLATVGKINEETMMIPLGGDGVSDRGFAFVEFASAQEAFAAIKKFHNTPLDKKHTLLLNKINDIEKFGREGRISEDYTPPTIPPFEPKEHVRSWLADPRARDQYAVLHGPTTSVFWHDKDEDKPTSLVSRDHWSDNFFQWSPLGTFMLSMHGQGIQLWEGPSWTRKNRFPHPGVLLASISPDEKHIVTWSQKPIAFNPADPGPFSFSDDGKNHVIWDIATGKPIRSFATILSSVSKEEMEMGKRPSVAQFKWSSDGQYIARLNFDEAVAVYELPSMQLIGKTSVKLKGVRDFDWSPAAIKRHGIDKPEQVFCFYSPEHDNVPAMVGLVSVPTKEIIRSHNPFNVLDIKLHWQSEGKYLCAKVDSMSKSKKHNGTRLDIFRPFEKGIPRETIEIKEEAVINLAWEPKGDRFVLISTTETGAISADVSRKTAVSFYAPEKAKEVTAGTFKLVRKTDKKTSNAIYWSPRGRFVATASVFPQRSFDIDFWDLDFQGGKDDEAHGLAAKLQLMNTSDHYNMTGGEWDPTGRYFATWADVHGKQGTEYGIHVYDLNGFQISQRPIDNLRQFAWRPRPPTFLSKKEQKEIRKALKDYSKIFDIQDQERKNRASQEVVEMRRKMLTDWYAWREIIGAEIGADLAVQYPATLEDGQTTEVIEKIVEEVLDENTEVIG